MDDTVLSVSEFVALTNQTLEFAMPIIRVQGEVSEYRVSKNRWVYFKLQDEDSSVQMFTSIYQLPQPLEDGMKVQVKGTPRLHNRYGFSINVQSATPVGEGAIKKAFELLKKKLSTEGLFDADRKRPIPQFPQRIGVVSSGQAAGYADFIEIIDQRWGGLEVLLADVQVQGEPAPAQIVAAIEYFNQMPDPVDVLVVTRGGGSAEDLQAFSDERVVRAVAASRTPTIVGVGHEVDMSLADLAADMRAATPTDAARLVVPDKSEMMQMINSNRRHIQNLLDAKISDSIFILSSSMQRIASFIATPLEQVSQAQHTVTQRLLGHLNIAMEHVGSQSRLLGSFNPHDVLRRGYAIARQQGVVLRSVKKLKIGDELMIELSDGSIDTEVKNVKP